MKACKKQTLRNERSENDEEREYTDDPSPSSEVESSQAKCEDVDLKSSQLETVEDLAPVERSKRERRPPGWLDDYFRD